jgi:glutathione synthase/RimK-type ligase-like ATP-grasp enzyme
MNVCIIRKKEDENARYLYEEFRKKDFSKVFLTDLVKLNARISNKRMGVNYKTELKDWDIYLMRSGVEDFPFSYLITSILEENSLVLPSSKAVLNCSNRGLLAKAFFESKTIQPLTYICFSTEAAKRIAMKFKKFALKFEKHCGKGVAILERPSTASELLDIFSDLPQPFCIQKFIEGNIIKALVVGEEVVGIKEYPKPGDEKSNVGKKEYIRLKEAVKTELLELSKRLQAFIFEVDLIERHRKYFAIDVSLCPDLKMYAELSGKNIGSIFADYILRNYSKWQSPLRF